MGRKLTFHTFCQISQNLLSNFFLFRAYRFLSMSSISHEELDAIESLEGGPPGIDSAPKMAIFKQYAHCLNWFINCYFLVKLWPHILVDVTYQPQTAGPFEMYCPV